MLKLHFSPSQTPRTSALESEAGLVKPIVYTRVGPRRRAAALAGRTTMERRVERQEIKGEENYRSYAACSTILSYSGGSSAIAVVTAKSTTFHVRKVGRWQKPTRATPSDRCSRARSSNAHCTGKVTLPDWHRRIEHKRIHQ